MRFLLLFIVCFTISSSIAQTIPVSDGSDYVESQKVHPSLLLKHSLGINMKEYLGLGMSYRYRSIKGLGIQVSYSPKLVYDPTQQAIEIAGLYTLVARTTDRYFLGIYRLRGKKDYNFYMYQSNIWLFSDGFRQNSHSINIGYEEVHWRKLATNASLGYIITPKTNFRMSVSFGVYYRF